MNIAAPPEPETDLPVTLSDIEMLFRILPAPSAIGLYPAHIAHFLRKVEAAQRRLVPPC